MIFLLDFAQYGELGRSVTGTIWQVGPDGPVPARNDLPGQEFLQGDPIHGPVDQWDLTPNQSRMLGVLREYAGDWLSAAEIDIGRLLEDLPLGADIPYTRAIQPESEHGRLILELAHDQAQYWAAMAAFRASEPDV